MTDSQLTHHLFASELPPHSKNKNIQSQIRRYNRWLQQTNRVLYQPDLNVYRDHLLTELSASSVRVHLSSIRRSYKFFIESVAHRQALIIYLQQKFPDDDFGSIKARADEIELRVVRAIDAEKSQVNVTSIQDEADSKHIRLTPTQGASLLMQPNISSLRGKRDLALIAMLLATGLREGEVVKLEVEDLYQTYGGVPSVTVKSGKGAKVRMVPFGDMLWARKITEKWLDRREHGFVFTKMQAGRGDMQQQSTTHQAMTTRSVQRLLKRYPIFIDGIPTTVTPHDLRRSYARNLFLVGIPMEVIRQNLGHVNIKTTQDYVGVLDGTSRSPSSVYDASNVLAQLGI